MRINGENMKINFVSKDFEKEKNSLKIATKKLINFSTSVKNIQLSEYLNNLLKNIDAPFLFVIVGEVKAGKSSFINALLKENICRVDIDICTDKVQEIVYSSNPFTENLSPHLTRIGLYNEILKDITIVDTPGTNSMIENHQIITEKFIPNSDLVFFVFSAANPHTKTAWELLSFVKKDWKKQVIFILQKSDLLTSEELKINEKRVKEYAKRYEINDPKVFSVSAKKEFEGNPESNFNQLRNHIKEKITGKESGRLKIKSVLLSLKEILSRLDFDMNLYKKELETYEEIKNKIKTSLKNDSEHSAYEIEMLSERLIKTYKEVADEFKDNLKNILTYGKFIKTIIPFRKDNSIKEEIEELVNSFKEKVQLKFQVEATESAGFFIESIRKLLDSLINEIDKLEEFTDDKSFFANIPDDKEKILEELKEKLENFKNSDDLIKPMKNMLPSSLSPALLTESTIAIISGIILTFTNITFLDVTGGILTGLGVIVSSGALIFKRNKIIKQFKIELERTEREFEEDIKRRLTEQFGIIYQTINKSFSSLYDYIEQNALKKQPMIERFEKLKTEIEDIMKSVEKKVN